MTPSTVKRELDILSDLLYGSENCLLLRTVCTGQWFCRLNDFVQILQLECCIVRYNKLQVNLSLYLKCSASQERDSRNTL